MPSTNMFKHLVLKVNNTYFVLIIILFLLSNPGLASVENTTCLDCHEDYDKILLPTSHQVTSPSADDKITVNCISCHEGAEVHIEDPQVGNIGNPAKQTTISAEQTCSSCHQPHIQTYVAGFDPHLNQLISCTDCHRIHSGTNSQLIDEEGGFCGKCHVSIVSQFSRHSNHPLTDQMVTCISCHDFTGVNNVNFGHGENANCYQCHPEQSGPYRFEHQAVSSFATEGEGCTACHHPHGSPNDRLLTQSGDGLCRQCHGVPPMHLTKHEGIGSKFACMECHSQVHGSYNSRNFLDPQLGIKVGDQPGSCYCHGIDDY